MKVKAGAIASNDAAVRTSVEDKLRGEAVKPEPPAGLTAGQAEIFRFIVDGLAAGEILGRMDVFALEARPLPWTGYGRSIPVIDEDPDLLLNSALQSSRAKYQSDLWRGAANCACRRRPGNWAAWPRKGEGA